MYKSRLYTKMRIWPGFLLKSSGIGRIIGQIGETCTHIGLPPPVARLRLAVYTKNPSSGLFICVGRPCFHRSIRMFQQEFGAIGIMLPSIDIESHSQGVLVRILRG